MPKALALDMGLRLGGLSSPFNGTELVTITLTVADPSDDGRWEGAWNNDPYDPTDLDPSGSIVWEQLASAVVSGAPGPSDYPYWMFSAFVIGFDNVPAGLTALNFVDATLILYATNKVTAGLDIEVVAQLTPTPAVDITTSDMIYDPAQFTWTLDDEAAAAAFTTGQYTPIDITAVVAEWLASGPTLPGRIQLRVGADDALATGQIFFATRNHGTTAFRPVLVIRRMP